MSSELTKAIDNVLSDERDVRIATASYQAEFPYERDEEAQVTRREFCNFLFHFDRDSIPSFLWL